MSVPKSLTDAINEEPERFVKYFNLKKISNSANPYSEFLRQFERKFGQKQGLNLWNYILDNYDFTNQFFNARGIQDSLPKEFKGNMDKNLVQDYFDNYKKRIEDRQKNKEKKIKKQKTIAGYERDGKMINSYKRSIPHKYTTIQNNFILNQKVEGSYALADTFNQAFSTKLSRFAIRDRLLRLLGKK